jgi:hypothetical protein
MFNQLDPAEVVTALGATVRSAARSTGPTSDFDRDQLMSAYSATRHLAVELSAYPPELRRFTQELTQLLLEADGAAPAVPVQAISGLRDAPDPAALGAALCELLDGLRQADSAGARALRSEVHVRLRRLADREVDLLADALG